MRKWILLVSIIAAVCLPFCFADADASGIGLPQELTVIADEAFAGDQSLTAVTIPEGTQRIGKRAFAGCGNLASLTIPSSVTEIGDDAFWGCSSGLIVECRPGSYAAVWCAENGISCAAPVLTAYIRQDWLDMLGLVLPSTVEELVDIVNGMQKWDVNGNGKADEIGMAAADFNAFPVAFQTIESGYEAEKVHLMMAAGELYGWTESDAPFEENALIVICTSLPAEYADEFVPLTAGTKPVVTPTPTKKPADPDTLTAYIRQEWLDMLGLVTPSTADELIKIVNNMHKWDINGNGKPDEMGMAAAGANDFAVPFQILEPQFETEKVMLLMAAGELTNWIESDTPFEENALIVVSTSLPAAYADAYVELKP